jgi:hypothetical protein
MKGLKRLQAPSVITLPTRTTSAKHCGKIIDTIDA